ncbi:MAG: CAP domain-containing protein [Deltaproteobacteria bacterium]|nr:CAP domain-containing protein [Deltaproteobacteria bacterium]
MNEKPVLRVINENTLIQCPDSKRLAEDMLSAVNRARQGIHRCGNRLFSPPGPVIWSDRLSQAALRHARDMAKNDFFDHLGSDGSDVGVRANAAGFSWRIVSENISAGFESPEAVVEDWLQSPPHCANLMNPTITAIGAACARNRKSFYGTYWVLIMALPHTKGDRRSRSQ